jgi:hypothetical protein
MGYGKLARLPSFLITHEVATGKGLRLIVLMEWNIRDATLAILLAAA